MSLVGALSLSLFEALSLSQGALSLSLFYVLSLSLCEVLSRGLVFIIFEALSLSLGPCFSLKSHSTRGIVYVSMVTHCIQSEQYFYTQQEAKEVACLGQSSLL